MEAATLTRAGSAAPPRLLRAASDERLVARLRAGDARAFEVIYDRYHLALLAFCRHMVGTREEAEDALQQVFVSAHGQLLRDDRPVQLRPWLYAIARNRCLSVLRARRETVALDDVAEPSADGLAVAAQVQQRQDLRDILRDLRQLPDLQRAALVLAELEDLSHEEIAQALDVRKDKVKALVFQAREALMGFRQARDADCTEIREQLATLRGGALRRTSLQRHLALCPGCAAFQDEVRRQRAVLGAIMPVVPALALRHQILGAVHATTAGTGAAAGAAAGGIGVATGSSSVAVKVLAAAAIAASAGGGAVAIRHATDAPPARHAPAVRAPVPATATAGTRTPQGTTSASATAGTRSAHGHRSVPRAPGTSRSGTAGGAAHGRTPGGPPPAGGPATGTGQGGGAGLAVPSAGAHGPGRAKVKPTRPKRNATVPGSNRPAALRPAPGHTTPAGSQRPKSTGTGTSAAPPSSRKSGSGRPARKTPTTPADPAPDPGG